jgi:hypothetical protein
MREIEDLVACELAEENEIFGGGGGKETCRALLCPPKIPHELTWD